MGQRTISGAELRAECTNLERAVIAQGLATADALAPHRPGGSENSGKDARAWLRYYAVLHRKHARVELEAQRDIRTRADAAVLQALRDEPVRVELVTPVPLEDGVETSTLLVYQKSLDALLQVHALDRQIAALLVQQERVESAAARGMPGAATLQERILEAIGYAYQLLAWILTTPGPAMPYELTPRGDPEPPAYVKALNPIDYPQIAGAAQQHHARLAAVQALIDQRPVSDGGKRPSWSQFIGSLAIELDEDAVQLTKFRSLATLLATVQLDADAKRVDSSDTPNRREPAY